MYVFSSKKTRLHTPWKEQVDNPTKYRKSSIKPPGGLFISNTFEGGLMETRALVNLAKTTVLVLLKELEYKVEKLKYKKLEVMQPRIRIKSDLPVGE